MRDVERLWIDHAETPIGTLAIVVSDDGRLRAVGWTQGHLGADVRSQGGSDRHPVEVAPARNPGGHTRALSAYFHGDLRAIDGLPVDARGTEFQRAVWRALREIPCGETCSYGELAKRIGRPSAMRAVGLANRANPIGIVVPCHRVIGSDGSLTGYAAGVERKRWLLTHGGALEPTLHPQCARTASSSAASGTGFRK